MRCDFPYFEDRPHIPIILKYKGEKKRFLPMLDSGADFSIFFKSHAVELGLDWSEGEAITLINADGTYFDAKQFRMDIEIEGYCFNARICFVQKTFNCTPTLGRRDIFKNFLISINEAAKIVEFKSC